MTIKALCWVVTRTDGEVMRATNLDVDLEVTAVGYAGTYNASAGVRGTAIKNNSSMAVDNIEMSGAVNTSAEVNGRLYVTRSDIEGGLWDQCRVKVFETDVDDTSDVRILLNGVIGRIERTHEGEYKAEVRNLFHLLQQNIGETISLTCRAVLGSGLETPSIKRCGVDLSAYVVAGSIDVILRNRYDWTDAALVQPVGYFRDGIVTWTSGDNIGIRSQVRRHPTTGRIILDSATPFAMTVGDTYDITPGCDKTFATCKAKFNNGINFRGEPFTPGLDTILAGKGST